jgi:hypothetical protein
MNEIVTIKHVRAAGMCASGARNFCKLYGFNWSEFIKNGVPIAEIEHIDNALIKQVIEVARNGR